MELKRIIRKNQLLKNVYNSFNISDCLNEKEGALYELKKNPDDATEELSFKLIDKIQISPDTFIYTYQLPENMNLGLNLGQHIAIDSFIKTTEFPEGEPVTRKYTPISGIFEKGNFKLLIKVYFKDTHPQFPDGGKMSQYLNELIVGESSITVRGPFGKLTYKGEGEYKILKKFKPQTFLERKFTKVCMLAGGTGITPFYQILQAAHHNKDITEFIMIFGNKTPKDILMEKELTELIEAKNMKLTLHYLIDKQEEGWNGLTGYINKEMITNYFCEPNDETLILMCGPPVMCKIAKTLFSELGHKEDCIFEF